MNGKLAPIVFLLGPSGSGKTTLACWLAEDLRFLHIEVDRWPEGDGVDLAGLRREWDAFVEFGKVGDLAAVIGERVCVAPKDGAVLSFPSTLVLPIALFEAAETHGIRLLVLYGTGAECLAAFLQRERDLGRGLDANHWVVNNARTYAEFIRPEYSKY